MNKTRGLALVSACMLSAGCTHAPSVGIIGSFFPGWMICLIAGLIFAFVGRFLLLRYKMEAEVTPLAVFYPCVVVLFTCLCWLIIFR